MKHFVALAVFVPSVSVTAQVEHAPTVAQCQADQRLWLSQLEDGDRSSLPAFSVLMDESKEIYVCLKVDPPNWLLYYKTSAVLDGEREISTLASLTDTASTSNSLKRTKQGCVER